MSDAAGERRTRLRRLSPGMYGLDLHGEPHVVLRTTDGTLGSAVIWDVQRERDHALVAHFTLLDEVRRWAAQVGP